MARRKRTPSSSQTGSRIRELRLAKGLTQIELGRRLGLSSRMMAYYEVQGGEPRPELLVKIAEVLGVTVDTLAGRPTIEQPATIAREDLSLWRRLKRIQELPLHDRKALLKMIDAMAEQAERRKAS